MNICSPFYFFFWTILWLEKKRDTYHSGKYLIFPLKYTLVLQAAMPSTARSVTRSLSKGAKPRAQQEVKSGELEGWTSPASSSGARLRQEVGHARWPSREWEPLLTRHSASPTTCGGRALPPRSGALGQVVCVEASGPRLGALVVPIPLQVTKKKDHTASTSSQSGLKRRNQNSWWNEDRCSTGLMLEFLQQNQWFPSLLIKHRLRRDVQRICADMLINEKNVDKGWTRSFAL